MTKPRGSRRRAFATLVVLLALTMATVVATPTIADWLRAEAQAVTLDGLRADGGSPGPGSRGGAPQPEKVPWQGGESTWIVAPGGTDTVGKGELYRYRVEVEAGTGLAAAEVARVVDRTLRDPRGWTNEPVAFQRVDSGDAEMVIRVASPATVDRLCAPMDTNGEVSCTNGTIIALNLDRWNQGVDAYAAAVADYRVLVINHEVGHRIGHAGHPPCPGQGRPAPVMMQVYYTGLQGCARNSWPYTEDGAYIG